MNEGAICSGVVRHEQSIALFIDGGRMRLAIRYYGNDTSG